MSALKKKISKKIKEFIKNFRYVRFYDSEEPAILIGLNNRAKVRTYLNIMLRAREYYDKPVVMRFSLLRYFLLAKWFKTLDWIYFLKPFSKEKIHREFSDSGRADFKISYRYKKVYSTDAYVPNALPYIMHPVNYVLPRPGRLDKSVGILISGNFEEKMYSSNFINKQFNMLNRRDVYDEIIKHPALIRITGDELVSGLGSALYKDRFVLMKWQDGAIPTEEWRHYLSCAKFLFCAPGVTMPMCHNVIEALSVGVIPIINYGNWLNPSLRDGIDCLAYKDREDIGRVITKALDMDESGRKKMERNVSDYYAKYYGAFDFEKMINSEIIVVNENAKDLI